MWVLQLRIEVFLSFKSVFFLYFFYELRWFFSQEVCGGFGIILVGSNKKFGCIFCISYFVYIYIYQVFRLGFRFGILFSDEVERISGENGNFFIVSRFYKGLFYLMVYLKYVSQWVFFFLCLRLGWWDIGELVGFFSIVFSFYVG